MANSHLKDYQWERLYPELQNISFIYTGNEAACRRFVEGVLWIARTGAQWRELPKRYGRWNSVYKRFNRWSSRGAWAFVIERIPEFKDLENLLIDSSVIRAHPCAVGGKGGTTSRD